MSRSSIPRVLRDAVFERDRGRCTYCGLAQLGHGATFHIDHVVPHSKEGPTSLDNLALQCPSCSLHKSDKITAVDPETGVETKLFHPLQESWEGHFRMEGRRDAHRAHPRRTGTIAPDRGPASELATVANLFSTSSLKMV